MALLYQEWRFRRNIPITHDQYEAEPVDLVEWFSEFDRVEAAVEADQRAKAERAQRSGLGGR